MFDFLKMNRINKITRDHAENVSDSLILMNIVNSQDAKKNLSQEEYKNFLDMFSEISKRKDEIPSNSLQYEQRAFSIAYEFECDAGVPYDKICGDANDILFMYSNMKPKYDELINDLYDEYTGIIDSLIRNNNLSGTADKVWSYSVSFFVMSTSTVINSFQSLRLDFFTKFIYERCFKKLSEMVVIEYVKSHDRIPEYKALRTKIEQVHTEAYNNNDTLDGYIETYTNSFLFLAGAPDSAFEKARLIKMLGDLKALGEKAN
ncbi:hypothetical protein [Butyrivibrio fibrisolvens]|uniref:hypothetical protein n=1 Tax=Butyrivibrio fibrisolvens TaxID=831 RepID=UPI0003B61B0D|nr:hypothetical protein [Butyrivibrio fibrisolvens]